MTIAERPLTLGEVFAETTRLYGDRVWAALALGGLSAAAFVGGVLVHPAVLVLAIAVAVTVGWAAATRLAAGDGLVEALGQVAVRAPLLLVFTVVATIPFALILTQNVVVTFAVHILFAVAWLAATGFSIPVVMVERAPEEERGVQLLGWILRRSLALARAEFVHAVGVIAALAIAYFLLFVLLNGALRGFAEQAEVAAAALAQAVLAPFFCLGRAVLYFEQRARAVSSRGGRR